MLKLLVENRCFAGLHRSYRVHSRELVLYWLSGPSCTAEDVMQKAATSGWHLFVDPSQEAQELLVVVPWRM